MLADDLDANEVDNELGKIDNDFRAGLDAYTEGRYDDCIRSLDDVLAALPTHEQALELRQQAVALRRGRAGADRRAADRLSARPGSPARLIGVRVAGALAGAVSRVASPAPVPRGPRPPRRRRTTREPGRLGDPQRRR